MIKKILKRMKQITVYYEYVEAHGDDDGNNRADLLAKKAAGIYTGSLRHG